MSRKKQSFIGALFIALVTAALVFTGCPTDPGTTLESFATPPVTGYFRGSSPAPYDDSFEITGSGPYTFKWYANGDKELTVAGTVENYDSTSKIMIIKITESGSGSSINYEVGKYFGVAFDSKSALGINMNTANGGFAPLPGHDKDTGVETLGEAITEYTIANGYFNYLATTAYGIAPVLSALTGVLNGITVTWSAIPGATSYDICASNVGDYGWVIPETLFDEPNTVNTSNVTLTITPANFSAAFDDIEGAWYITDPTYVWIRAKNSSITGPWIFIGTGQATD